MAEGIRFVFARKIVLGSISLDLFAVLLWGAVYLLPVFADRMAADPANAPLGMSSEQILGMLRAAPALGADLMALFLAYRPPIRRTGRTLLINVAGFGLATIVFGLSRNFWLSAFALFLTGAFDNVSMVIRHGVVQLATPNEMRGRVSAVSSVFIGSSNELGGFESGLVAHIFSPVVSVVSGGIGTIVVVLTRAVYRYHSSMHVVWRTWICSSSRRSSRTWSEIGNDASAWLFWIDKNDYCGYNNVCKLSVFAI